MIKGNATSGISGKKFSNRRTIDCPKPRKEGSPLLAETITPPFETNRIVPRSEHWFCGNLNALKLLGGERILAIARRYGANGRRGKNWACD